jgi:4-alpha-glucanotransferase
VGSDRLSRVTTVKKLTGEALLRRRSSGVLLHVTSLPGGRLGPAAYEFVDWLEAAGQSWWQVLPLNPPDAFGSPYTSSSAFATWRGLLADPEARVTRAELRSFRRRNEYWIEDWERYAGPGATADQVRFEREWQALRRYAAGRGVHLIGDIPIYIAEESADVAAHPELFSAGRVAGAAPDVSHPDGQLWGQPAYNWTEMRRLGYRWWVERFQRTLELVDVARLDHFRGFVAYWAIAAGETDPRKGCWQRGPGAALFQAVETELGQLPLIAEDLGLITLAVDRLRRDLRLLGMRIVGRGFVRRHRRRHAVATHPEDAVVYTGTHDHPTLAQWVSAASERELAPARADIVRAGIEDDDLVWALVRLALSSRGRVAILPMQDVLELGAEARMNEPGTFGGRNWQWRLEPGQASAEAAERLRDATAKSRRLAPVARRALVAAG